MRLRERGADDWQDHDLIGPGIVRVRGRGVELELDEIYADSSAETGCTITGAEHAALAAGGLLGCPPNCPDGIVIVVPGSPGDGLDQTAQAV